MRRHPFKKPGKADGRFFDPFPIYTITGARRHDCALNEARLLQYFQVLGYRGLRKRQPVDKVPAHTYMAFSEIAQDCQSNRVRKRFGESGDCFIHRLS